VSPAPLQPGLPPGVLRWPALLSPEDAAAALHALVAALPWESHTFRIFGRALPMPRRICWFGPVPYAYSGVVHPPAPLPPAVAALQGAVVAATGLPFNAVLCNLYRDGADSMGWHTDDDHPSGGQPAVASLSLGAARRFCWRARDGSARWETTLQAGELLLLPGPHLREVLHALPRDRRVSAARVNLTFRHHGAP
jgi:alkylated DNA repair dioxygenase AlkB